LQKYPAWLTSEDTPTYFNILHTQNIYLLCSLDDITGAGVFNNRIWSR